MSRKGWKSLGAALLEVPGLLGTFAWLYDGHHWGAIVACAGVLGAIGLAASLRDLRAEEGVTLSALLWTFLSIGLIGIAVWVARTKFNGMAWIAAAAGPFALIGGQLAILSYLERRRDDRDEGARAEPDRFADLPDYWRPR